MRLLIFLSLTILTSRVFSQQSEYYQKAAQSYLIAASKTKCPERANVLKEYARWYQCMVDLLAGKKSSCGEQPTKPIPPCDGDLIGNGDNSSSGNSNSMKEMQLKQQHQQEELNNAIQTTGNTIWDIIQSGRARKESTGKAIVNSFAKDLYERKKSIKFYDDVVCDKCNGSGTLIYNDNPNSIIYGQSHPCEQCNGIGRINKLKSEYDFTETHGPTFLDLANYLLKSQSNSIPLCTLNPSGYKGSVEMRIKVTVGGHNDDLVLIVMTLFSFLDRKGKYDANGYVYNSVSDIRVFPLNAIKSFVIVPSKMETNEGTSVQYNSHIMLVSTTNETFEFTTNNDLLTVSDRLNELLNTVKKSNLNSNLQSSSTEIMNEGVEYARQGNLKLARQSYQSAAEQGNPYGMHTIGQFYEIGLAGEQNYAKSLEWFTKASKAGYPNSDKDIHRVMAKMKNQ